MSVESMVLFGSTTSPFVRRVRVVAEMLDMPVRMVNTMTDDGQKELAQVAPLKKIPVASISGELVFDSHAILDVLLSQNREKAQQAGFRLPAATGSAAWIRESNLCLAVDGALESAIRVFYVRRDGVDIETIPYLKKEHIRVAETMAWVDAQISDTPVAADTLASRFGLFELSLATTLDWMRFRSAFDFSGLPHLAAFYAASSTLPCLQSTTPRV